MKAGAACATAVSEYPPCRSGRRHRPRTLELSEVSRLRSRQALWESSWRTRKIPQLAEGQIAEADSTSAPVAAAFLFRAAAYGQMREGASPAANVVSLLLRTQVRLLHRLLFAAKRQSGAAHGRDRQSALLAVRFDAQVTTGT